MSETPARAEMNLLGRYLCHMAETYGHTEIKTALREAGMTRRQFDYLAFGERDHRESVIRRAVESFSGSMREFYLENWNATRESVAEMLSREMGDDDERPKFNRPRPDQR